MSHSLRAPISPSVSLVRLRLRISTLRIQISIENKDLTPKRRPSHFVAYE
jgi:hypothetical protein